MAHEWGIRDYDDGDENFWGKNQGITVQTSILSVCQFVKAEAIEVLYDAKVLRGWPIDLDVMMQSHDVSSRAKHIEITGLTGFLYDHRMDIKTRHTRHLRDLLERLQPLPKLRSITILSDSLTVGFYASPSRDTWVPVMDFVSEADLEPATCIDIGRYQLHGKFKDVQIVNSRLVEMWPAVRDTPEGYDGFNDAVNIITNLQSSIDAPNVPAWASHTSLRCWVDIQQQYLVMHTSGELNQLLDKEDSGAFDDEDEYTDDQFKLEFFRRVAHGAVRLTLSACPLLRYGGPALRQLQPNDNSDLLNEVSQYLAVNIEGYYRTNHPSMNLARELCPVVWATNGDDTNRTGVEYMTQQQDIALSDGASEEFILDPTLDSVIPACNLIERRSCSSWVRAFDNRLWMDGCRSDTATPDEMKQLTYLHMAVLQPYSVESDTQHRRNNWAADLMRRYFRASGRLSENEIMRASLVDLRAVMSTVLNVFDAVGLDYGRDDGRGWLETFSRNSGLPPDFDSGLFPGLGWKYGLFLAKAFSRYTSEGYISRTLAYQWLKECTMWN